MSGLYLHIPFCKQACHYCNFHFSTSQRQRSAMVSALLLELERRASYLPSPQLHSIYFGGGTPSLLLPQELEALFTGIQRHFTIDSTAEITLEANPDDLTLDYLRFLRNTPVNRLSIGIQSFADVDLAAMNRAHVGTEARTCLEQALDVGFQAITVDLIYGAPTTTDAIWASNLTTVFDLNIPHLSAYCLTVEPRTALHHFVATGQQPPVDEAQAARQFHYLLEASATAGYEHYEISNFARPGHRARHNSSYWLGEPYLGIGPSAHSFDGTSRQWNVANNSLYLRALQQQAPEELWTEKEILTPAQRYNEYVMTSLRTSWGLDLQRLDPSERAFFLQRIAPYVTAGQVVQQGNHFTLSREGKFLADHITVAVFWEKD